MKKYYARIIFRKYKKYFFKIFKKREFNVRKIYVFIETIE